ncbi:alpha-2-macroglobulin-like [Drosophila pseudoobscura]|uniref:Alpha-2-macroglobulin-like n=1 Tax=Drosophila pseudoobscura pseudoobscura TaxID=46245 RepID=A0A6I8VY99_DROPS|nr:alpha-2-macroglobulin [Drosophila pseudoobscura]
MLLDSFTVAVGAILTLLLVVGQVTAEIKYTVVGPGSIKSNRDYNVAIAVHYTKEPVTVKIGITGPSHNETRTVEFTKSNVFKQLSFELPPLQPGDYDLTADGVSGLVFKDSVRLIWDSPNPMLFLHIDKFEYKPGDTVNYRVMILDEQLRPNLKAEDIVVCLRDPTDFYIDKARPARTTTGVYTGKFHLSKLASLGEWTIDFEDTDGEPYRSDVYTFTFFNVERYVEPKYLVRIDAPKLVSVKDGVVQIFVLAKYSYGTRVEGKVVVNIELFSDESVKKLTNHTVMVAQDMVKGKATFDINLNQFASWVTKQNSKYLVAINATVEDHLTGKKITETGELKLVLNRHLVSCVDMHECYTYSKDKEKEVIISITKLDSTLPTDTDSVVKLKYSEGKQDFFGVYNRPSENKNRTFIFDGHLNTSGLVVFKVTLPGFPNKMRFWPYDLTLLYAGEQYELRQAFPVNLWGGGFKLGKNIAWSKTQHFSLYVHGPRDSKGALVGLRVGDEFEVTLSSIVPFKYYIYTIIGRGNILHTKRIDLVQPKTAHNFTVKTTFLNSPRVYIYAYYISEDGVLYYTETNYLVLVSFSNELVISAPLAGKPGDKVDVEITTEPTSFVGLFAVDERLIQSNKIRNEMPHSDLDWRLDQFNSRTYCHCPGSSSGLVTMTNANFSSKSGFRAINSADSAYPTNTSGPPASGIPKRTFNAFGFSWNSAESWFFTDIERTETAVSKLSHTLPDALGRLVINGFSLHPQKGLGVPPNSKMTVISTSIPYFISVRLPHSMKLGEWIRVPVIVDNYVPQEFDMEATLDNPDAKFDFADASNQGQNLTQVIRVGANEAAGASFLIRPKVIGNILLKFSAISPLAGDAVHKSLKVIPEGITKYQNRAFFVNLKDVGEYKNTFELEVPEDIVPDSQRVEFGLVGDLLGPVIKNLENLLRLPSGCGEQTMFKLVPNYLVRDYLKSIKKLTPAIETRIKRNLQEGYQNMLHYRHDDGSFSSFGPGKWREEDPDRNGSTWLTSYVLRSFRNIKDIIYLNENLFTSAYKFLLSRQAENGSFTDAREYFYGSQRSSLTLTANALLALLEQDKKNQTAIDKAVAYLSAHTEESEELLPKSIAVYALQKSKAPDAAKHVASLKALAQQEDDRTWWTEDTEKLRAFKGCRRWWCWVWSHDVEITSYALLTLLETEQETPDSVLNTIRWLVAQRNSFGGFASSQDTVVGLQALIKFAEKSGYEAAKWEVSVSNKGKREKTEKLSATEENDLVLQTVEFPQGTQSLEFEAKGTGAALIQISYQYNVVEKETKPSFKIQTIVKPESSPAKLELSVCVEYVEEGKAKASNMAILEVSLPSGYTADEDSFKDIKDIERVRLVETKNGDSVIVVYFENLLRGELKCIPFDAFRTHAVANQKPAPVVLYDYYDTNKKATEYYQIESKLCDICEDSECKAAVSYLK